MSQAKPLVIVGVDALLVRSVDELLCCPEVVLRVLDRAFREVQRERRSHVAGWLDGRVCQGLHGPSLVGTARGNQVVIEARDVPRPQNVRDSRQGERNSACGDPNLWGNRKHACDAKPDFRLLSRGKRVAQGPIREPDRVVAVPRDVQRDRRRADDLAAQWMVARRDFQGSSTQLCGRPRIACDQALRRFEERGDRDLVTELGARGKLHRDFDRQCAAAQKHVGRPSVNRSTG